MANHTPGPWTCAKNTRSDNRILALDEKQIASVALMNDKRDADAALIAAAPEMFDALKGIIAAHGDNAEDVEGLQDAIKAIRKAEGK